MQGIAPKRLARSASSEPSMPVAATASAEPLPRRERRRRVPWLLAIGLGLVLLLALVAALASLISPYDPNRTFSGRSLEPPSQEFLLGTDSIGRDVLSRVLHGSRVSLTVVVPAIGMSLLLGLALGLAAGYLGGRTDQLIMRLLDVVFAFPVILLAIAVVAVLGPSVPNLVLTIGIIYMPAMARVVRAPVLSVKRWEYVEAGRALGATGFGIVLRHIVPNILSPVIVEASLALSRAIYTETALSFLGLGPPPPNPTWGSMLAQSRQFMEFAPWTALAPGLAIGLATMTFILLGNGLRDYLDPRSGA
jgi:peptide/nickel transport system permease protein